MARKPTFKRNGSVGVEVGRLRHGLDVLVLEIKTEPREHEADFLIADVTTLVTIEDAERLLDVGLSRQAVVAHNRLEFFIVDLAVA